MSEIALVRYGAVPEVARFRINGAGAFARGDHVVVETHRGVELGVHLQTTVRTSNAESNGDADSDGAEPEQSVLRRANADDLAASGNLRSRAETEFAEWQDRIEQWKLELELIDLEWTLDGSKLVLYVLNERGPDCTKLALQAAAAGLGVIEVQPVDADGLMQLETGGGGCGSGGCGSGGCSS